MKPLTDACTPRDEVLGGVLAEDIFAAELTPVVAGTAPAVYGDAATFFANTYPTEGLQALAREVFTRLSGRGGNPLIRLETTFGGGKTHGLIALYHVAREAGLAPAELLDADLRPDAPVRTAAISGRDFGPEGRHHEGAQMHTLWGEIAWQLGGQEAYDLVAEADRQGLAPSGDAMSQVLGDTPALVMLDEIGRYLRVAQGRKLSGRGTVADQVPPFLHALAAAASTSPRAVVVISLAAEQDAYQDENEEVRLQLQRSASEIQKITARQELVIRPTQDAEVAHVVVRRLFSHVDWDAAAQTARAYHEAYQAAVDKEGADLPPRVSRPGYRDELTQTFPFHPELLRVLMTKTASIPEFQRTRGALRLLARMVRAVWAQATPDTFLIHPFDADFADEQTRNELTSRLGPDRAELAPVIQADIFGSAGDAHAQELDGNWTARGKPPLASRLAKVIFLHSLTHGRAGRAEVPDILLACAQPSLDTQFLRDALQELSGKCWYLHNDETSFWFNKEVNVNKVIDEHLEQVTQAQGKEECRTRLRSIYEGGQLRTVYFPERAADVDDDGERIKLCVMDFDFISLRTGDPCPATVRRIYEKAGTLEGFRSYRNALVVLAADAHQTPAMVNAARLHRALQHIITTPDILSSLNETNQKAIQERVGTAEMELRVAITRAYRHLLIPNPDAATDDSGLQAVTLDVEQAAKIERERKAGRAGQEGVITDALAEHGKLMKGDDPHPAPELVADIAWPKGQQTMTTEDLSRAFRRNPHLPMLLDAHRLRATVRAGVERERWVYFNGERIYNSRHAAELKEADVRLDAEHELWTFPEANTRGFCGDCGYRECRCKPVPETCPQCRAPRVECQCDPCATCNRKPWECECVTPPAPREFDSGRKAPQMAFAALDDWVLDSRIERLDWLEIECYDRPADLQQVWIGVQYFVDPMSIEAEFRGSVEIVRAQLSEAQGAMQSDTAAVEFLGSGQGFRRIFDFYHALAQGQEHVEFFARFRALLPNTLAPDAGEISDLRARLEREGVLQVTLRARAVTEATQ